MKEGIADVKGVMRCVVWMFGGLVAGWFIGVWLCLPVAVFIYMVRNWL